MQKNKTILVIDDDQDVLDMVSEALSIEGYDAVVKDNGEAALEEIKQHNPQLVLLDIKMPGIDGFEVLRQIRKNSKIPVIILSGVQEAFAVSHSLDEGADDYIKKPFSIQELMAHIRAKLRRTDPPVQKNQPAGL
jgi:DNA-binding response OmpR family regulator